MMKTVRVTLAGRGDVSLGPADHLATGGEGSVYRKAGTVIKLYTDSSKMSRDGMADKLAMLAKLDHPYMVGPKGLVFDTAGRPVGYYMDYTDGEPMARAFTNDFRMRYGFGDQETNIAAERMREVMTYAHGNHAVMADANELNWIIKLGGRDGPVPQVLDVDSWAIGRWPATVIMPSIRDWHTKGLCEASDHFAWAVVTFQLYTGIHPYKGMVNGYRPGELTRRMQDNVSVFAPGVRLNQAVRDMRSIPAPLLGWYESVFRDGKREYPPSPLDVRGTTVRGPQVTRILVGGPQQLRYELLYGGADAAIRSFDCGVVVLASGALFDLERQRIIGPGDHNSEVVRVDGGWLVADYIGGKLEVAYIDATSLVREPLRVGLEASGLVRFANRLFAVTAGGLTELRLMRFSRPIVTAGQTWGALPNATKWFDGVGVMDSMGVSYLIAPFSDNACAQVRVRELDGLRPIAAKAGTRYVIVVAADKNGDYQRLELHFDANYTSYTVRQTATDSPEINATILPRGVVASIVRDGELVITAPSSGETRVMADRDISTATALAAWNDRVTCLRGGQVVAISMTK